MTDKQKKTVSIDGTEYTLDELSDKAKSNLANLHITDREIARLQQLLAIAQTARNAYAKALKEELPKKDESVQ